MTHSNEQQQPTILTRYKTKVHASNRNADYGLPVTVYASSRVEAIDRAIAVGWAGPTRDARVTLLSVEQVVNPTADDRAAEDA